MFNLVVWKLNAATYLPQNRVRHFVVGTNRVFLPFRHGPTVPQLPSHVGPWAQALEARFGVGAGPWQVCLMDRHRPSHARFASGSAPLSASQGAPLPLPPTTWPYLGGTRGGPSDPARSAGPSRSQSERGSRHSSTFGFLTRSSSGAAFDQEARRWQQYSETEARRSWGVQ